MILGPAEIERLLPHRAPFLLVSRVEHHDPDRQALTATFEVGSHHPVLAGHFPGRPLWPGVYTIEGLAQACGLLLGLRPGRGASGTVFAGANVRLTAPVIPPATLEYQVALSHEQGGVRRFEVSAFVDRAEVARGTLTLADAEPRR